MSALPPPRDPAALPRRRRSRFSRSSSASRFERAAFSTLMRRGDRFVLTDSRARALAAFGPPRITLTRMPDRTFNLGHGAACESDRSLPTCGLLRNRAKERRPGGASPPRSLRRSRKSMNDPTRKTRLLERWIRNEVLSSRSRTRFFDRPDRFPSRPLSLGRAILRNAGLPLQYRDRTTQSTRYKFGFGLMSSLLFHPICVYFPMYSNNYIGNNYIGTMYLSRT